MFFKFVFFPNIVSITECYKLSPRYFYAFISRATDTKILLIYNKTNFFLHYGDLTDTNSIYNIIHKIRPHEIYNLGAQSHVGVSFENPEYTSEVSGIGTLRLLEAIRFLKIKNTKFYQASNSLGIYKITQE